MHPAHPNRAGRSNITSVPSIASYDQAIKIKPDCHQAQNNRKFAFNRLVTTWHDQDLDAFEHRDYSTAIQTLQKTYQTIQTERKPQRDLSRSTGGEFSEIVDFFVVIA
jgi:hypothetical protein